MTTASNPLRSWLADRSGQGSGLWLMLWALVLVVGLLSFCVHLLQEHVELGDRLRQAQRSTGQIGLVRAKAGSDDAAPALPSVLITANLR